MEDIERTVCTFARQDLTPIREAIKNTRPLQEYASPSPDDLHNCTSAPRLRSGLRQSLGGIIPVQVSNLEIAFLIGIGLPIVVIEREVAIGSGVDLHMDDTLCVMCALDSASQRHN